MNNLPNDIIFNICRFMEYPEVNAFNNISISIDRAILNNEFYKFYFEYCYIDNTGRFKTHTL